MICLECSKLDLQTYKKHAATGMGRCSVDVETEIRQRKVNPDYPTSFVSIAYDRQCGNFVAAEAEVKQKRIDWWKGKGK